MFPVIIDTDVFCDLEQPILITFSFLEHVELFLGSKQEFSFLHQLEHFLGWKHEYGWGVKYVKDKMVDHYAILETNRKEMEFLKNQLTLRRAAMHIED